MSDRMARLIQQLADQAEPHALETLQAIRATIPEYAAMSDPVIGREVVAMVATNVQVHCAALINGQAPTDEELKATESLLRRRVHQGIPLSAVLNAFRVGFRVQWDRLLALVESDEKLRDEMLQKVSPYLLYQQDELALRLMSAYEQELAERAPWRDRVRHELCGILYSDTPNEAAFRDRAALLGMDAAAAHTGLALRIRNSSAGIDQQQLQTNRLLDAACISLGLDRQTILRTMHPGHLVLWLPLPVGETSAAYGCRVAERSRALSSRETEIEAVGIGLTESGVTGWRASADQAIHAAEMGMRLDPGQHVYAYSDYALEHAVIESPTLTRLFQHLLERLVAEPKLLETLHAWCDRGPHRKVVANTLGIHPNSLSYRLKRIETLLGQRLDDFRQLPRLQLALRVRQLSVATKHSDAPS